MILGLTGGYCTGKSSAAKLLIALGWQIIDVDKLGHKALENSINAVKALLGPEVVMPDGKADRKIIAAMVFSNPLLMLRYEAIVHPAMNKLVEASLAEASHKGQKVCIDAAILYKLPVLDKCDAVLELRAPLLKRLMRARQRDGVSLVDAMLRIHRQQALRKFVKNITIPVSIVQNKGSLEDLDYRIKNALKAIQE